MARDWEWKDLIGIGNLTGDPDPFFGSLSGQNATKDAAAAQQDAIKKAFEAIIGASNKGMEYQAPYLKNAASDFEKHRGLVQGGYYQTPGKSFQGQSYTPSGFSFNPSQGGASFSPWQRQGGAPSMTPQGMPSQAGYNIPPPTPSQGLVSPQIQPQQQQQQAPGLLGGPQNFQMRGNPTAGMQSVQQMNPLPQMPNNVPQQVQNQYGARPGNPQPDPLEFLKMRLGLLRGSPTAPYGGMI